MHDYYSDIWSKAHINLSQWKYKFNFLPFQTNLKDKDTKWAYSSLWQNNLSARNLLKGNFYSGKTTNSKQVLNFIDIDVLYHICMEIIKVRSYFQLDEEIYVNYVATEDFETLIGTIQIPPELLGEENLQSIYKVAKELTNLNKNIL